MLKGQVDELNLIEARNDLLLRLASDISRLQNRFGLAGNTGLCDVEIAD